MASDVVVPEVGETGMDVTLVRWRKQAGEPVAVGDILFELDTAKTVVEVEAWTAGILTDVRAHEGDVVSPRQIIARIQAPGEASVPATGPGSPPTDATDDAPGAATSSSTPGAPPIAAAPTRASTATSGGASPRARRLAKERAIDLATVTGTGPEGLVTERDVLAVSGVEMEET